MIPADPRTPLIPLALRLDTSLGVRPFFTDSCVVHHLIDSKQLTGASARKIYLA
jgi:hypothetical protein